MYATRVLQSIAYNAPKFVNRSNAPITFTRNLTLLSRSAQKQAISTTNTSLITKAVKPISTPATLFTPLARKMSTLAPAAGGYSTAKLALIGSALGLGLVCVTNLASSSDSAETTATYGSSTAAVLKRDELAVSRVRSTFAYTAGGLASTALFAAQFFKMGLHHKIMALNPIAFCVGSIVCTLGAVFATRAIPYENTIPKHVAWLASTAAVGAGLTTLGMFGGPLLLKAAIGTGCIVGGLSLVAATAPNDYFLQFGGLAAIGLCTVMGASIGSMFLPGSTLLYNVALYGGLGVFGFMLLYDVQAISHQARNAPIMHYDPINTSYGLYFTVINIFTRMVAILSGNNRKR